MQTDLIIVREYCIKSQIEPSFITSLADEGLIDIQTIEGEEYLLITQLPQLERYIRWHYDLSINIEGIDAIRHLLIQMNAMQQEIYQLRRKVSTFMGDID